MKAHFPPTARVNVRDVALQHCLITGVSVAHTRKTEQHYNNDQQLAVGAYR